MQLHDLKPSDGSRRRRRRVGRGQGSGLGGTAGRGHKGQRSRTGSSVRPWFEGGQMPLFRRLPKRGFKVPHRHRFTIVNLGDLDVFDEGATVRPEDLLASRVVRNLALPVKVLGDGELTKPLRVCAHHFSRAATAKIRAAGGEIEVLA